MSTMITILGPTASGKTRLAALVANKLNGEVISADSRQVYRGMNLGTGKDYNDYIVNGKQVPYHLIDILEPGEEYNVYRYQQDFFRAYTGILQHGKLPLLCGGTGLYLESVLCAYKMGEAPENDTLREFLETKSQNDLVAYLASLRPLHNTTDSRNRKRTIRAIEIASYELEHQAEARSLPRLNPLIIGITYERQVLRQRITERLKARLEQGMVSEVEELLNKGISTEKLEYYGLEYRYLSQLIAGKISYEEMFRNLNTAIHQFAKRQMTWFRRMERKGFKIHWLDSESTTEMKVESILRMIS